MDELFAPIFFIKRVLVERQRCRIPRKADVHSAGQCI